MPKSKRGREYVVFDEVAKFDEAEYDRLKKVIPTYVLQTGKLSLRAQLELDERTRKGEDPVAVKMELLLREGKGVPG